jgi:peptidoglycan hydrolase CwlO-like protein
MKLRRTARLLMTAVLILSMVMPVKSKAASNSISDAKQKQSKAQEELDSKKGEITSLEKLKSDLDTYLADINEQTAELSDSLLELETQSAEKQTELEQTQKELEEAKATEAAQYEDMKKRIKFMYESSNTEYIDLLLSAENFTDFLNRAENISSISTYDRNMLMEYEATKITIVEKEQKIQEESKALEELLAQTQAKQDELYATANSTKKK